MLEKKSGWLAGTPAGWLASIAADLRQPRLLRLLGDVFVLPRNIIGECLFPGPHSIDF